MVQDFQIEGLEAFGSKIFEWKLMNQKLSNQELQMDCLREAGHNKKDPTKATTKETTKGTTKKQREPKRNLKGPKRNRMKAVSGVQRSTIFRNLNYYS